MRVWTLFAAVSVVLAMTSPAMACQPLRGTPEEVAASVAAHQAGAWDNADLVFVARIEQRRMQPATNYSPCTEPHVTLMPLTSLKGQVGPWQFELGPLKTTMCGPAALGGQVGDEFIIFMKGDTPMQEALIDTIRLKSLVEPRALAALKAAE
jgi:hypothetical protein